MEEFPLLFVFPLQLWQYIQGAAQAVMGFVGALSSMTSITEEG